MKFSALISVYNKENGNYLKEALNSIWDDQILKPDEIILVKDGPLTDELEEVLKWFESNCNCLQIIELKENNGLANALNVGLEHCNFSLVARMDSDDISFPNRFKKQISYFKNQPNTDILGGQALEFVEKKDSLFGARNVPLTMIDIKKFSEYRCPFNHPTVMFRKEIIQKLGGYQDFPIMEDYHLWVRAISNGAICANLSDNLLFFRISRKLITRRTGFLYFRQELKFALFRLKIGNVSTLKIILVALFRSSVRLLPRSLFAFLFKKFHNKTQTK
jgi:glycosyltransferase involved in cell wall biosynthesis